ncbi:hypothetical protein, partial [Streptococcus pluranimalium]
GSDVFKGHPSVYPLWAYKFQNFLPRQGGKSPQTSHLRWQRSSGVFFLTMPFRQQQTPLAFFLWLAKQKRENSEGIFAVSSYLDTFRINSHAICTHFAPPKPLRGVGLGNKKKLDPWSKL